MVPNWTDPLQYAGKYSNHNERDNLEPEEKFNQTQAYGY